MKKLVIYVFLTIVPALSLAETPSIKSIVEFLDLCGVGPVVTESVEQFRIQTITNVNNKIAKSFPNIDSLTPLQKQAHAQGYKKLIDKINTFYHWNNLRGISVGIYQKIFTQQEINDLIVFAKTPTGKNYWKKNREVELASQKIGEQTGISFVAAIDRETDGLITEMSQKK